MIGRRSPRRARREGSRPAAAALAGVLTLLAITGFIFLAENAYNGLPFLSYRTLDVSLPSIGHLQQHDPVDIAGVRVGQVLSTSTRNNRALIELQLQGVGPLPADSRVVVRAAGLLGQRYVELDPGSSRTLLANGATITEGGGTYTSGLPETLNLFDPATRTAMGQLLNGLGEGVFGRGTQLGQAIHVGPITGQDFDAAAYSILSRPGAAANFLPYAASGIGALDQARDPLTGSFAPGAKSLQPLIAARPAVEQALSAFPGLEQSVNTNLAAPGERLVTSLDRLAETSAVALPYVPSALGSATALLRGAPGPLARTDTVLAAVPRAVPATLVILASLRPDLTPLTQTFTKLVAPVSVLAMHGCDIQSWATGLRSIVSFGTFPGGHFGPDVGFPLTVIAGPQEANNVIGTHIPYPTENPYPAPCSYSPGATISESTLTQVLAGVLR
jgi:phospholipid/cholesterol/gamma-HCH transport system substrate-binding protein